MANDDHCAQKLKLLADDTRLAVLRILLHGPHNVGQLNEALRMEPTLLSHHLRLLREAGMVLAERRGKAVVYRLAPSMEASSEGTLDLGCCQLRFHQPV